MVNINQLQQSNARIFCENMNGGGAQLDLSIESLKKVDDWLEKKRVGILELEKYDTIILAGAYLGETIRKQFGGSWETSEKETAQPIVLIVNGATLNPLGKVRKFFENGRMDSLHFFVKVVEDQRKQGRL